MARIQAEETYKWLSHVYSSVASRGCLTQSKAARPGDRVQNRLLKVPEWSPREHLGAQHLHVQTFGREHCDLEPRVGRI